MTVLGLVIEHVETEFLDPAIDRTFAIMLRMGALPPPPKEIQGQTLRVEYISVLAQAAKLVNVPALANFSTFVAQLATVNPGGAGCSELGRDRAGVRGFLRRVAQEHQSAAGDRRRPSGARQAATTGSSDPSDGGSVQVRKKSFGRKTLTENNACSRRSPGQNAQSPIPPSTP